MDPSILLFLELAYWEVLKLNVLCLLWWKLCALNTIFSLATATFLLYHRTGRCSMLWGMHCSRSALLMIQSNTAMIEVSQELSSWIADDHPDLEPSESVAVSAFHVILSEQAIYVANDFAHARLLVDMLLRRDAEPDGQSCLDTTWPVPMTISWERSYYTLRTIYNEAIKKLGCIVSVIRVVKIGVRQFRASVDVSAL